MYFMKNHEEKARYFQSGPQWSEQMTLSPLELLHTGIFPQIASSTQSASESETLAYKGLF